MKTIILSVLLVCVGFIATPSVVDAQTKEDGKAKPLKVGDKAPDWTLKGSDGKTYKLSKYKGKQAVIVSWYPMALTGG